MVFSFSAIVIRIYQATLARAKCQALLSFGTVVLLEGKVAS